MTALCTSICTDRPRDCVQCATDIDDATFDAAWDAAESAVHELLGRRYGECEDTIEACVGSACACSCSCDNCRRLTIIIHDRMPITSIVSATVTPLPTDDDPTPTSTPITGLTIRNFNEITFPHGTTSFPEGVIRITFRYGKPYPPGTCLAVRDLAAEFVQSLSCNCECSLPSNVQSYVRGDISYSFVPVETLQELRMSGVPTLDVLLRTYGTRRRPTIYSPDIHRQPTGLLNNSGLGSSCVRWYRVTG